MTARGYRGLPRAPPGRPEPGAPRDGPWRPPIPAPAGPPSFSRRPASGGSPPPTATVVRWSFRSATSSTDARLYSAVDAKPKRTRELRRLRNVADNPRVSLVVDEYDEDWTRLRYVIVEGRADVLPAVRSSPRAIDLLVAKYSSVPHTLRPPVSAAP